jgi:hypothetical protein
MHSHSMNFTIRLVAVTLMLFTVGCGRARGPARHDLSGSVTFHGKPVPVGTISFAPDTSKGNDGPGASAEIKDGVYSIRPGRGTIGGPHVVSISGFDGKPYKIGQDVYRAGKPLFPGVQIRVDLPKEPAKHDFALPIRQ